MQIDIITPDKKVYSGECSSVSVPGSDGRMQFLKNHAPLISSLGNGKVKVKASDGMHEFNISGGVVEVLKNKIILLAEKVIS